MTEFIFLGKDSSFKGLVSFASEAVGVKQAESSLEEALKNFQDLSPESLYFLSLHENTWDEIEAQSGKLKTLPTILCLDSKDHLDNLSSKNLSWLKGIIFLDLPLATSLPLIDSVLKFSLLQAKTEALVKVGKNLGKVATSAIKQTEKLKGLHGGLVGIRKQTHKGVNFYSKFAAGTEPGGDFFDYTLEDNGIGILLCSSKSYLVTSYLLSFLPLFKSLNLEFEEKSKNFLTKVTEELRGQKVPFEDTKLALLNLNTSNLTIEGHLFGDHQIYQNDEPVTLGNTYPLDVNFLEQAEVKISLKPNDIVKVLSSGVDQNYRAKSQEIGKFMKEGWDGEKPIEENLNELFYIGKKGDQDKFMKYDATAVILEVSKNVIYSV
ncbi:MAG: hypothetical protein ACPGJV_06725 [Bacteriovoracaceae bacterium]